MMHCLEVLKRKAVQNNDTFDVVCANARNNVISYLANARNNVISYLQMNTRETEPKARRMLLSNLQHRTSWLSYFLPRWDFSSFAQWTIWSFRLVDLFQNTENWVRIDMFRFVSQYSKLWRRFWIRWGKQKVDNIPFQYCIIHISEPVQTTHQL